MLCVLIVISMREDHGAPRPEQDRPPPAAGGDLEPGQFLQGVDPRAEGQSAEGPV